MDRYEKTNLDSVGLSGRVSDGENPVGGALGGLLGSLGDIW